MTAPGHVVALRGLLSRRPRSLLSVPGCWDGFSALLVARAGFEMAFLTGGGLSMARLGRPDMGLVTAGELADAVSLIRDRIDLPLIVDADNGFGNALNVARTVRSIERAGASAIQLEDQVFPKRCGHMAGKSVVPLGEAIGKLHAALDAREDALIVARTDVLSIEGLDAALDRADAFREAGTDLVFVEGPRTMAELQAIATWFGERVPPVHNLVEGGVTPTEDGAVLERLGFAVALHPLLLLHCLMCAALDWLATLRRQRSMRSLAGVIGTLPELAGLVGAEELAAEGNAYALRQGDPQAPRQNSAISRPNPSL